MGRMKSILLWVMGIFYIFAGIMHFANTGFYVPMMPPYLPWHLQLIYLSGVAEIACGVGVLIPTWRSLAAWATIALLIAVFPANIHIALHNVPLAGAREGAGVWNWVRLPFQAVLIAWAWWYTDSSSGRSGELRGAAASSLSDLAARSDQRERTLAKTPAAGPSA